jgi:hypothetical protein
MMTLVARFLAATYVFPLASIGETAFKRILIYNTNE